MAVRTEPHPYRGWRSTKLHLSLISMALMCGGYWFAGSPESFGALCTGLVAAAGLYSGAAAAEKFAK